MSRDDSRDDDLDDDEQEAEQSPESSWTAVGRYLTPKRADAMQDALEEAGIQTRVGLEGRSSHELIRVRVPADRLDDAEDALFELLEDIAPETPDPSRYAGALGKMRRRRELARLTSELEEALGADDSDSVIEILWKAVAVDPDDSHNRRQLVGALLDRDSRGDTFLARWWVEHAMRRHGVAAMAAEMAGIAIAEDSLDEAEAWLDEAALSGADPAEVAFERCNLAFAKGELRELKQAASDFRRSCDIPDSNWVELAAMLAAAGEIDRAGQMLGTALRDSPLLVEDEWTLAAALRMVAEGADDQSRDELIDLVGEDEADDLEAEASSWLKELQKDWKRALEGSKKAKRAQHSQKKNSRDHSKRRRK
ncbi:MAG: hypothetical protein DCC49_03375 [Acidobacteria bacterium]|nr:MAG: hypothetical protein DCC49_03375 [Acidobacteriota bacterium]